jgi:hypothetical protein
MKITKQESKGLEIEVKRFVVPFVITDVCPDCGVSVESGETQNYFSYPQLGVPEQVSFCCDCGAEWTDDVVIELRIRPA